VHLEVSLAQELEGVLGAALRGEPGDGADQGHPVDGQGLRKGLDDLSYPPGKTRRDGGVVTGRKFGPVTAPAMRVDEKRSEIGEQAGELIVVGDRPEILPEPFVGGELLSLGVRSQPPLDLLQREGRAGRRTADRLGKVVVAAPPVAHRRPPHAGQSRGVRGGHLNVSPHVGHLPQAPPM
jgi:hypothetical protein